jgi:hypothetical protein
MKHSRDRCCDVVQPVELQIFMCYVLPSSLSSNAPCGPFTVYPLDLVEDGDAMGLFNGISKYWQNYQIF